MKFKKIKSEKMGLGMLRTLKSDAWHESGIINSIISINNYYIYYLFIISIYYIEFI